MTQVIFRMFSEGDVIALFPNEIADIDKKYIVSYMRIGQHSCACPSLALTLDTPTKDEALKLFKELVCIGYDDLEDLTFGLEKTK